MKKKYDFPCTVNLLYLLLLQIKIYIMNNTIVLIREGKDFKVIYPKTKK